MGLWLTGCVTCASLASVLISVTKSQGGGMTQESRNTVKSRQNGGNPTRHKNYSKAGRVTVRGLSAGTLARIDSYVDAGLYASRSAFVASAVKRLLAPSRA